MHVTEVVRQGDVLAGKYRLDRVLGVGGMAAVFAATNLDLQKVVAIKVVRPALAAEDEYLRRLLREARIIAQMKSHHVTRVYDVGTLEGGAPFMVMELLDGIDLESLLKERRSLPVGEAVDYVLQTCEALAEAHSLGIVHRDLKPANLFLATDVDKRPFIKVLDFGLSMYSAHERDTTIITQPLSVMGTPVYMSPEQLRSSHDVDARTDIWALGVILYELLSGSPPWAGKSVIDVCASIVRDPPPPLAAPRALVAVIERCLHKNPKERFGKVGAVAAAIGPFAFAEAERAARVMRVQPVTGMPPAPFEPRPVVLPRVDAKANTIVVNGEAFADAEPPTRPAPRKRRRERNAGRMHELPPESVTETLHVGRKSWTLAVIAGIDAGRVFSLRTVSRKKGKSAGDESAERVFKIGRASDCDVPLRDRGVSRHHASLVVTGQSVVLRDNGAKNGTFVNGRRIDVQALSGGDEIRVGPLVSLRFLSDASG